MSKKLKLGLVGADASGRGWAPIAHIPALRGLEQIELAALCTSRPESAAAAAKVYGIDRTYHDVNHLVEQPDIDIISAVVKIPNHREVVLAALNAGKHVFSEWPLGSTLDETEEMAAKARSSGLITAIGLQGRYDPTIMYIRDLFMEGWFGEVLSVHMTMQTPGSYQRPSHQSYQEEISRRADLMTIAGGHTLDYISYCFGPLTDISARVETQINHLTMVDSGEKVKAQAADHIFLHSVLNNGALLSFQISAVPINPSGWRMAVYGSKGMIIASTRMLPQITPIKLVGTRSDQEPVEMSAPERLRVVPAAVPEGPAQNVGQLYINMAEAIIAGKDFNPNFDDALGVHKLLESIQRSSDQGITIKL